MPFFSASHAVQRISTFNMAVFWGVDPSARSTFDRMPPLDGLCLAAALGPTKSFAIWNTKCGPPHFRCEWNSRTVFVRFARRP